MVKRLLFIFLLLTLVPLWAAPNELLPLPTVFLDDASLQHDFIDTLLNQRFFPISYQDYLQGYIAAPKKYVPYLLIRPEDHANIVLISHNTQAFNLLPYHFDYDPLDPLRAVPVSQIDPKSWAKGLLSLNLHKSDGKAKQISVPKNQLDSVFIYAPSTNMTLYIPTFWFVGKRQPYPNKAVYMKKKNLPEKGIHFSVGGLNTRQKRYDALNSMREKNIDTLIVDFKSYLYPLQRNFSSYQEFIEMPNQDMKELLSMLDLTVNFFKKWDRKVSFRIVVAQDSFISKYRTDLLLWDKTKNQVWTDTYNQTWLDLYADEVLLYYQKIVELACNFDIDDIQFDYIRFPSEGKTENLISTHKENLPKAKAIDRFLKHMATYLTRKNIGLSADIFGIVLWEKPATTEKLGQHIDTLLRYCDVVAPMLYPSHFHKGFEGIPNPGSQPYLLMERGTARFAKLSSEMSNYPVRMIPWLQAFDYLSPNYGPDYIKAQIRAIKSTGMHGFFAWNARNDYQVFLQSL